MATWNSDNIILTKLGEQVLSKVQSGVGKLTVSRIVSGAGHVSPAQLYSQTQITDIKQEMSVVKYTTNEQQSVISANLTNTGLEEAYDLYQIGIYVTHPDFTDEVLYLIAQCDSPDHIPMPGDSPVTLSYDLVMAHFGTKEVTINVSEAGHVDVTTFNEFIEKTNTALNRKADLSDIPTTLPANGGNADTVGGKHAYEFSQIVDYGDSPTSTNTVPPSGAITIYRCSNWTNYPDGASDGKGILIVVCYEGFGFVGASDMWVRQLYITPHNNYKIWQRVITDTTVGEWTNIADGGNADTVGNKGISQILAVKGYFSGNMDNLKEQGSYIANEATNMPISGGWGTVLVFVGGTGSVVQIFTAYVTSASDLCKTYIRHFTGNLWSTWVNIADNGNADTVDGKHANDFMQNLGTLTTGSLLDYVLTLTVSGCLLVTGKVTDTPVSGVNFFVDVRRHINGDYSITATRFNAGGVYTNRYNAGMAKWYGWANVADGGNAATLETHPASDFVLNSDYASSTSSGIVSTGEQHFRGRKFFDDSIFISNPDFLVGSTLPSADTTRLLIFASSDNSTGNASAYMQNVARAAGNNELIMALRSLTSKKTLNALCAKINADGSNHYTYVTNPTQSTQVALRNISSGTSAATTTNCPSGSWYGKHS